MAGAIEPINTNDGGEARLRKTYTLGSVRHRHEHTNEILLIPSPSKDPNDPLNWWVQLFKLEMPL